MANFCPNCGNKLNAGAKFCSSCGKNINESAGAILIDNAVEKINNQGFVNRFFKQTGRLNRTAFNIRLAVLYITRYILVLALAHLWADRSGNFTEGRAIIVMLLSCVFIYSIYCTNVRREHDLDKSLTPEGEEKSSSTTLSDMIGFFDAMLLVVVFWPNVPTSGKGLLLLKWSPYIALAVFLGQFYLMVRKGVTGPNRYGPDPLQK